MITQRIPRRALVVDDGRSGTALALARELAAGGHAVGLATADPTSFVARSKAFSRRHVVPAASRDLPGFLAAVAELGDEYDVAIATGDIELLALAFGESALPMTLAQPPLAVLRAVLDKATISAAAESVGIATPRSWPVGQLPDSTPDQLAVKPRLHWDPTQPDVTAGATQILARAEVDALGNRPDLLAQVAEVGALGALVVVLDRSGQLVAQHQQIADTVYPVGAGNCVRGHTVAVDAERLDRACALLRGIGFWGLAQLEYLEQPDGTVQLIDVNPRAYGSMSLAVHAGLAPSTALLEVALSDSEVAPRVSRPGVRYSSLGLDARRAVIERRGGLWRDLITSATRAAGSAHAVWDRKDPQPALRQWRATAGRALHKLNRRGRADAPG